MIKQKVLFFILLLSSLKGFSQTFVEVSNQAVSLKSRDRLYGGDLDTASNLNPKLSARLTLYKTKLYSWYLDGSSSYYMFNKNNFNNNNQLLNQAAIGFRLRPESHIALELLLGYKETPIIYSSNGQYFMDKQGVPTIGMKGALALKQLDQVTIIGEVSGTYFVKQNGYNGHEVGLGISAGSSWNDQYFKVGYKLEHESNYNNSTSNSLLKNSFFFRLHF